jgi:hypothetical protein
LKTIARDTEGAGALIAFQVARRRSFPRAAPNVHHLYDLGRPVDREEHAVHVTTVAVVEHTNGLIRVEALGCHRAPFGEALQRENGLFETVEPRRSLTGVLLGLTWTINLDIFERINGRAQQSVVRAVPPFA